MATNFGDRVKAGQANATVLSTSEAKAALDASESALIIDVRDPADLGATGVIPGSVNISPPAWIIAPVRVAGCSWRATMHLIAMLAENASVTAMVIDVIALHRKYRIAVFCRISG